MKKILPFLLHIMAALTVQAQIPANDNCAGAINLPIGPNCVNTNGTVANATASTPSGCTGNNNDDVWYKFTATGTSHRIQVTGTSGFDPVLQVFDGSCTASSLVCKDGGGNSETLILNNLTVGKTYVFRVYHYSASITTTPAFQVCVTTYVLPVITLTNQPNLVVCGGSSFTVPFTHTSTFDAGNTFYVELSDASGSFTSPTTIGSGSASPVTATPPNTIPSGTGYKVRIRSSNPVVQSGVSNYTVHIKNIAINVSSTNGTTFTATATGGVGPYLYSTNGTTYSTNNVFTGLATGQNYTIYAKDAQGCVNSLVFRFNDPAKCNVLTASGGQGTTFTPHTLGITPGLVSITYDMYSIPDQIDVFYNGAQVASTNGLVSGSNTLTFNYTPAPNGPYECIIRMYAPLSGTAWEYFAGCPQGGGSAGNAINSSPVTTCNYLVNSPNFPANYGNNTNITKTFTPATSGKKLKLEFTAFHTESSDYVYVYNGPNTSAPLLGTFSGNSIPPAVTATNPTGQLTVKFTTDGSVNYKGWQAAVSCEDPVVYTTISNTTITTCSQNIASPGYGSLYPPNSNITQTIMPATGGKKVKLKFMNFSTENNLDQLKIYDGSTTAAPLIGTYSGNNLPPAALSTAANGALTLVFTTNATNQAAGWLAEVGCSNTGIAIGSAAVNTCNYTVTSPNYPANYGNSANFTQTFNPATAGNKLKLTFNAIDLESGYDFIYVYDGPNTSAPLLGKFSGTTLPPVLSATSSAGNLTLRFTSDGSGTRKGFSADLSCFATNPSDITAAPLTTCNSLITSPYYPSPYLAGLNITKVISPATSGKFIQLDFNEFNTESGFDYLRIYDGSSTSAPLLRTLSGRETGAQVKANNAAGKLTLQFVTDQTVQAKGWSAAVSCANVSGITETAAFKTITYFPNPAAGELNIKGEQFLGKRCTVSLTNLVGKTVYSSHIILQDTSFETKINTAGFVPGVYMLSIKDENSVNSYKIVIAR